jgi:quercetin dioxygenase-like cupin family protein
MNKHSLTATAREHLQRAHRAPAGRSAATIYGGHERPLRQTLFAMVAGTKLDDHENPGDATVHVLSGRVRLRCGNESWDARLGDLLIIPAAVHSLFAVADTVVLLTAVPRGHAS